MKKTPLLPEEKIEKYTKYYLEEGKDLALIWAIEDVSALKARSCFWDVMENIIAQGVNHEAETERGVNLVSAAIFSKDPQIVRRVLEIAPELINKRDRHGYTPFLLATKAKSSLEIMQILTAAGADKKMRGPDGKTAGDIYNFRSGPKVFQKNDDNRERALQSYIFKNRERS